MTEVVKTKEQEVAKKQVKKRPGRPKIPDKKLPVSIRLAPSVVQYLRMWDKPATVVQALIEASDDYQQWKGKQCTAN